MKKSGIHSLLFSVLLIPTFLNAVEPICPGGSQPRADITWCAGHELVGHQNCNSGGEMSCIEANGHYPQTAYSMFKIIKDAPAVGTGSIAGKALPGSTGPGYLIMPEQSGSIAASLRFYIKFSEGFLQTSWDRGHHGPSIESNFGDCSARLSVDWYYDGGSYIVQSSCSDSFLLPNNIKEVSFKNNRWYLIEMQVKMNTNAAGTDPFSGNGLARVFVDGEKVLEYTNINYRANKQNILWTGAYTARSYYGNGIPSWSGLISYDNFVYSNSGQYIGPAKNENARGTPDPLSPYINFSSYNGFVGTKLDNDCYSSGAFGYAGTENHWRNQNAANLSSEQSHGKYVNYCSDAYKTKPRVVVTTIRDGGTLLPQGESPNELPLHIEGNVLIPTDGNYTSPKLVTGFGDTTVSNPKDSSGFKNYVGFGVSGGNWAIIKRTNGGTPSVVHNTQIAVQKDFIHDFSFTIKKNNLIDFTLNGKNILASYAPSGGLTWAWEQSTSKVAAAIIGTPDTNLTSEADKSLKIRLTSSKDGGGVEYYKTPAKFSNAYVIHGWIYLPSTNNYSTPVALSGFSRYGNDSTHPERESNWAKYVALSVSDKKWALVHKNGGSPSILSKTNVSVQFDSWNEFEIFVDKNSKISLMINREWVIEDYSSSLNWIWDDYSGGMRSIVLGVLDFNGPPPFTAYYDDTSVLTASAWSCKGWHVSSCPYK